MRSLITLLWTAACAAAFAAPGVTAKSAIVIDADTGKVLYEKDADTKRYPASTTKIMTGLLLLETLAPDEWITAPVDIEKIKGSTMHLKPGEQVRAEDMLYALMLRSANDGCYAIAKQLGGSVAGFSKMMNKRAQQLGCTRTNFNNPNGLNDPKHLTTARDLALIAREAMKYPAFEEVVGTKKRAITRTVNFEDQVMVNKNKLMAADPSVDGIKTGWTIPAGHCFVGSATRDGYRIITVVLKSENWTRDTKLLVDWAFNTHSRQIVKPAHEVTDEVEVVGGSDGKVQVAPGKDIAVIRANDTNIAWELELNAEPVEAPVHSGQRVGTYIVRDSDGHKHYVPAVAVGLVTERTIVQAATTGAGGYILGVALVGGTLFARGKSRRTKRYAPRGTTSH